MTFTALNSITFLRDLQIDKYKIKRINGSLMQIYLPGRSQKGWGKCLIFLLHLFDSILY